MRRRIDSRAKLRLLLGALLLGLAVPAWLLYRQAASQLDLAAFRREQLAAEDTARRIDAGLSAAIAVEEGRPFTDYEFAPRLGSAGNVVQRSPLSVWPRAASLPGVIGHFQVDASGRLTTPLLPADADAADFGLAEADRGARRAVETRILGVLGENRLVRDAPAGSREQQVPGAGLELARVGRTVGQRAEVAGRDDPLLPASVAPPLEAPSVADSPRGQARFDELAANSGTLDAAKLADSADAAVEAEADRPAAPAALASGAHVSTFESELERLQFSRLDTGHLVLFRNAWRDGARFVQGLLLDQGEFLQGAVAEPFRAGGHAEGTRLFASIDALAPLELTPQPPSGARVRGERALHTVRLSPPLAQIELAFAAAELPRGPAERVLLWTAIVLGCVLLGGTYAVYRFGAQQVELTRQREDFVSAVSHELKTPLTSIRMYGEMLKSGWASEDKKRDYYDFILAEGERLSRLIDNVLKVARFERGGMRLELESSAAGELVDVVRAKVATQVERAGFTLTIEVDPAARPALVCVDQDAFVQIFINLIDNAIKFASDAQRREIVLSAALLDRNDVLFCVRDFGPGVAPSGMQRLFELFYRPDDERTRAAAGTGIGLALVKQLATSMHGTVDVRNRDPGAELRLRLPRSDRAR